LYDSTINNSHLICKECKQKLPHETKHEWLTNGQWIPSKTNTDWRGFYINQLYSATVSPVEFAKAVVKSRASAADEQELYNSKLGMPHSPEGSRVTDTHLTECINQHKKEIKVPSYGIICMGVDVGKFLHVEIGTYTFPQTYNSTIDLNSQCQYKLLNELKVTEFSELDRLMAEYQIQMCVIDIHPERRMAYDFACRHYGRVRLCMYPEGINGKQINENDGEMTVAVDRTSWLDISLGRFKAKTISLPIDVSLEYREHIKSLVRVYKKDQYGQQIARYVSGNTPDHFGHARNYCEVALPLAAGMSRAKTIRAN
jgi:hypothetical protein